MYSEKLKVQGSKTVTIILVAVFVLSLSSLL